MYTLRFLTIRLMRLFFGGEAAEVAKFIARPQLGNPRILRGLLFVSNPFQSMAGASFAVRAILSVRGFAQVIPAIVRSIAISVVDLLSRPFLGHVEPDQTVRPILMPFDHHIDVPLGVQCSRCLSSAKTSPLHEAYQFARRGFVMQCLEKFLVQNHSLFYNAHQFSGRPVSCH